MRFASPTHKMTLARQRDLSSSEGRASDLEHGGSRVRIPSGLGFFSESPFYAKNVSYCKIKTFFLSDAKYPTDNPSQTNNPSLVWNRHRDAFSSFHTSSSAQPPPLSTSKKFVGNGQKLVQTRESWKIQRKVNNVLAGKRKRVLVRKTRPLATLLSILSVVTISFLFQIHLFILWQNARIVASRLISLF